MSAPKASIRAVVDRLVQHYFDQLYERLSAEVRHSRSELEASFPALREGVHAEAWASGQDTREALQEAVQDAYASLLREVHEAKGALQRDLRRGLDEVTTSTQSEVHEAKGALQRDLRSGLDEAKGALQRDLRRGLDEVTTSTQSEVHEAKGALQRDLRSGLDEAKGALQEDLTSTRLKSDQRHREALSEIGETRGALQRELTSLRDEVYAALVSARDEVRGTVELFRTAFDDFRAQVEPRVFGLEKRMDVLELRMMTYQTLQKDFAQMRSRDMAAVRSEAAALRDDLRRDMADLSRMLMMQGDAADQVAEALGRTLARLSGELEALAPVADEPGTLREAAAQPA